MSRGIYRMVYCTRCGTNNADDARVCSNCGAPLYATGRSRDTERIEGECFGIPTRSVYFGIIFGVIIIFFGVFLFLQQFNILPENMEIWPFIVMIFGILIIIGALSRRSRSY